MAEHDSVRIIEPSNPTPGLQTTGIVDNVVLSSPISSNVARGDLVIRPTRAFTGTNRYLDYPVAATEIMKVPLTFNSSELKPISNVWVVFLNEFADRIECLANQGPGVIRGFKIWSRLNGVRTVYYGGGQNTWSFDGSLINLVNGKHHFKVKLYNGDESIAETDINFQVQVLDGAITHCLSQPEITCITDIEDGKRYEIDWSTRNSASSMLPYSVDLRDMFNTLIQSRKFDQYEAYRFVSLVIQLTSVDNWLKSNVPILVYFVRDPLRVTDLPIVIEKYSYTFYPHLDCKKLFSSLNNLTWKVPVSNAMYYTSVGVEPRLCSPGGFSIVPLPGYPSSTPHMKYAFTVMAELEFFCQTETRIPTAISHWLTLPALLPKVFLCHGSINARVGATMSLNTSGETFGRLFPRNPPQLQINIGVNNYLTYFTEIRVIALDTVWFGFANLSNFDIDFEEGLSVDLVVLSSFDNLYCFMP